jgi:[acyl-carrier-protein] S-malonyltransferase
MGEALAQAFPSARAIFEKADALLGYSLSRLCWEGPAEELTRTEHCQPALYVSSLAALAALGKDLQPKAAAGLSLGEYSALAAAGVFSFEEGLRLVRLRGQAMEEAASACPGTMASVLGIEKAVLEEVCAAAGAEVANLNSPGQIVISGTPEAVGRAGEQAKARGAKRVIPLEVGGAFHSRLMKPAADRLDGALGAAAPAMPRFPVLSNVTGSYYTSSGEVRTLLREQLTRPVLWEACMRTMLASGIRTFLEVGAGTVLKGLARKIDPQAVVLPVGSPEEVKAAAQAIGP